MYLIICSVIYILCLTCLCFLDFTDPEPKKELARKVTEYAENLMTAVIEVLNATESAFLRVPAKDRVHLTALNWVKNYIDCANILKFHLSSLNYFFSIRRCPIVQI